VRGNHALTDWLVQRGGYRFYTDTFGITAHSIESETHLRLPAANEMWVFPILRFHRQSASRYLVYPGHRRSIPGSSPPTETSVASTAGATAEGGSG